MILEVKIGSVRRECLDHAIVLSERHLRSVLGDYLVVPDPNLRESEGRLRSCYRESPGEPGSRAGRSMRSAEPTTGVLWSRSSGLP